jgi:3',5'-cyclic AMP phosphodiesterase CpdA
MEANEAGEALFSTPATRFPFVRRFGDVAIVALSSAIPTMPFIAAGRVGAAQRALLAEILTELRRQNLFRAVLIHHPPLRDQAGWHRGLRDAIKFADVLKRHGAELVLHGHNHAQTVHELETATGTAILVGVPSASEAVEGGVPAARYNEYSIARVDGGWRVAMVGRSVTANPERVWECERRVLRKR